MNQGFRGIPVPVGSQIMPYILIQDQKASGTAGGAFTNGAWQTRVLNTIVVDTAGIARLASNQITLPPGTYRFASSAPAFTVGRNQTRLQNITTGATLGLSTPTYSGPPMPVTHGVGRFTSLTIVVLELQHRAELTRSSPADGFGLACSFGTNEIYAQIEFWKEP